MYLTNLAIKKENGMSLISFAVIIAIIAIPILSTININMEEGDLINLISESTQKYIVSSEKESISLAWSSVFINKYLNNEDITAENIKNELISIGNNVTIDNDESGNYIATFIDTNHTYIIQQNGSIEQLS